MFAISLRTIGVFRPRSVPLKKEMFHVPTHQLDVKVGHLYLLCHVRVRTKFDERSLISGQGRKVIDEPFVQLAGMSLFPPDYLTNLSVIGVAGTVSNTV